MGKTVSFVATDELAEWLEEKAEARRTSISSTTQQLLAEQWRQEDEVEEQPQQPSTIAEEIDDERQGTLQRASPRQQATLVQFEDRWHISSGEKSKYAIRTMDGNLDYFKTLDGLVKGLERRFAQT